MGAPGKATKTRKAAQPIEVVRLRPSEVRAHHLRDVSDLLHTLGSKQTSITLVELKRSARTNRLFCAIAQRNGSPRMVGLVCLVPMYLPQGLRLWLETMVVHDDFRASGLGSLLLARAMQEATELGAEHVNLTCNPTRAAAHVLYEKSGFAPAETTVLRRILPVKAKNR